MIIEDEEQYDRAVAELDKLLDDGVDYDDPRVVALSDAIEMYDDKHYNPGDRRDDDVPLDDDEDERRYGPKY